MTHIMTSTFSERMAGGELTPAQVGAIGDWLDAQPALPREVDDPSAVEAGRTLFESAEVGCADCHSGAKLTNNENRDIGTGRAFQVPSLVGVADRGPWMHDGCATTLGATLDACGISGASHGDVSGLGVAERADLLA